MLIHEDALREILKNTKSIAVLGAKDVPGSPVNMVGRYLIEKGFTVYPVHPARKTVWGLPVAKTLADLPGPVDMVNLFRAAQFCPGHAQETLALTPPPACFWMQTGIVSEAARNILSQRGVFVVEDRCLMVEHQRLLA